ncbi:MAG: hypothetical protein KAI94_01760 [Anaerolineales bacterium]|nr:hypothetical protein [Anaerolineales bacterium]
MSENLEKVEADFWQYLQDCLLFDISKHKRPISDDFYEFPDGDYLEHINVGGFLSALALLTSRDLISGTHDPYAGTYYSITRAGIEYLNTETATPNSVVYNHNRIDGWASKAIKQLVNLLGWDEIEAFENIGLPPTESRDIPAANRTVTIDHNSTAYIEAAEAVDAVIEAVRGDNEYGDRDPEDKEQRLAELTAGKKLIEAARASISAVDAVLIKTLAYLSGIGIAVTQIADAIIKVQILLGL